MKSFSILIFITILISCNQKENRNNLSPQKSDFLEVSDDYNIFGNWERCATSYNGTMHQMNVCPTIGLIQNGTGHFGIETIKSFTWTLKKSKLSIANCSILPDTFYYATFIKDKDLINLIEKRFAASQASKVDLLNAQVATEQIAQAILENRNDYDILLTQFRRIIHRPTDKTLMPLIPETVSIPTVVQSFDELVPMMLKNNQAVAAAQQTVESQQALLNNAKLQALPDFQFSAGRNDWVPTNVPSSPNFKGHDYTIGVGMVIPLFFALDGLQGIHAAAKNRDAAENQLSSAQLQAISGLQTSYTSYKAALKDLVTSETLVVPAAKQSFELTLLTYALGKADYLIVNQSRQAWHEASRELINKRQNAVQLYNQLIAQVGCDLNQSEGPHACKN